MPEPQPARERILSRLRAAPARALPADPAPGGPVWAPPVHGDARLTRFRAMLEASRAEVHEAGAEDWPEILRTILAAKGVGSVLYAPNTATGRRLAEAWADAPAPTPALVAYDRPVEQVKPMLVERIDAAVTAALGGIAHTGTLVLWPTPEEPRLMSLLPPIHAVVVDRGTVADSLSAVITAERWTDGMPTNAVLVSGPSKTADIEQTLAYGVHGPKELIVMVIG